MIVRYTFSMLSHYASCAFRCSLLVIECKRMNGIDDLEIKSLGTAELASPRKAIIPP